MDVMAGKWRENDEFNAYRFWSVIIKIINLPNFTVSDFAIINFGIFSMQIFSSISLFLYNF